MDTRATYNYRNGERCAFEGCKFKDIDFHHTDYKRDLGVYLCRFHHMMQHIGKLNPVFEMLISRFIVLPASTSKNHDATAYEVRINLDASSINPLLNPDLEVNLTLKLRKKS